MKPEEQSGLVEHETSESNYYHQKSSKKEIEGDGRTKPVRKDEGLAKAVLVKMMTNMKVDEDFLVSDSCEF